MNGGNDFNVLHFFAVWAAMSAFCGVSFLIFYAVDEYLSARKGKK